MGTPLSDVYDLFIQTITDYRLIALYQSSPTNFETFLEAWLIFSINEFDNICDQSLEFSSTTKMFTEELSSKNKVMLAKLMTKFWMEKLVRDVTQMNLHITDRDFKTASEAQNLEKKTNHLIMLKEECAQMLLDYAYSGHDWTSWYNQDFAGG